MNKVNIYFDKNEDLQKIIIELLTDLIKENNIK